MHRFRSWTLDPPEYRTQRNRLLPIEGGDGSTLNLDFTTGVLDPRLTFSRMSNATFINSSGLVQYADANLVFDTGIVSAPTAPWNPFTATGGSNTLSNGVVVSASGSSGRAFYRQTLSNLAIGLQYSFAVEITAQSGEETYAQSVLPAAAGVTGSAQYYVNGSPRNSGDAIETGLVCVVWTAAATSIEMRIGVGANGSSANKSVTWTKPRAVPGNIQQPSYFANSSTADAYQSPRFDHDPTTRAPRGLLIEATATNLLQQSADWTVSPWSKPAQITWDGTTYATAPDGTNTAKQITVTGGSSASVAQGIANATNRTVSVWLRAGNLATFSVGAFDSSGGTTWGNNADSTCRIISGPGSVSQQVGGLWSVTGLSTTQWTRVEVFRSSSYGALLVYPGGTGTVTGTAFMWGMQMEAGNGASSLIPTGASQVQRLRDEVVLSNLSGISFNQSAGTMYSQLEIVEKLRGVFPPYGSFDTSGGGRCWWWLRHNHDTSVGQRILGTAFNSGGSTVITSSNYTHSSGVFKFATSLDPIAGRMVYAIAGGSAQVTNASGFTLATAAQMSLNKNNDVAATDLGSMWVRSIKYWPTALPDATLQSLTT